MNACKRWDHKSIALLKNEIRENEVVSVEALSEKLKRSKSGIISKVYELASHNKIDSIRIIKASKVINANYKRTSINVDENKQTEIMNTDEKIVINNENTMNIRYINKIEILQNGTISIFFK